MTIEVWDTDRRPPTEVQIRPSRPADLPVVTDTLAKAFYPDPVCAWLFPDDRRRAELLPGFFGLITDDIFRRGRILVADEGTGVRLFLPPNPPQPSAVEQEQLDAQMVAATAEYAEGRVLPLFELLDERHPSDRPHYYLAFSAVLPSAQRRGRGGALLRAVLDLADAEGTGTYVESSTRRSQRLMLRHGFTPLPSIDLPNGPSLYPSWREPQP